MHFTARICIQPGTPDWTPPERVDYIDLEAETLEDLVFMLMTPGDRRPKAECSICRLVYALLDEEQIFEAIEEGIVDGTGHRYGITRGEHDEMDHFLPT